MNLKALSFASIFVFLLAFVFVFPSFAGDDEEIEWSQVPPKVQETITEHMQGGEIEKIEREIKKKKKKITVIVYEAKVKKPDGKEIEIKVDENGTLIELESD